MPNETNADVPLRERILAALKQAGEASRKNKVIMLTTLFHLSVPGAGYYIDRVAKGKR